MKRNDNILRCSRNNWFEAIILCMCASMVFVSACKKRDEGQSTNNATQNTTDTDNNNNHMIDRYETAKDQGVDCAEKHHAGCIDGFCDSFIGYKCSTRCTSDEQCVSGEFFCRDDGRCAPKAFVSVWNVNRDNGDIVFPGGRGRGCNYTIDWGDGIHEDYTDCSKYRVHTYTHAGDYTITVTGTLLNWTCAPDGYVDFDETEKDDLHPHLCARELPYCKGGVKEIRSFGPVMLGKGAFFSANLLNKISEIDIPNANFTSAQGFFLDAELFNQPIENWDISKVNDTILMFGGAKSFNQPLKKWDTSNVIDMDGMFMGAASFNQPLQNWDTSKVTNMNGMFAKAASFNQPIEKWNTSNVKDMSFMFNGAVSFNQPLENWDLSNVKDYDVMFENSGLSKDNWEKMKKNKSWADKAEKLGLPEGY